MIADWHFYLAAIPAVFLMGLSKGGFSGLSALSAPLLSVFISPVKAAAIMLPILLVQDAVSVWAYRRTFDGRNLRTMLPGSILGILLGYVFAAQVTEAAVRLLVGCVAAGFVLYVWTRWLGRQPKAERKPSAPFGVLWGAAAGFTSFVSHAGGPPFQVHVMPQRLPPRIYAGTSTMFFAVTNAIKVVPYFLLGQFTSENLATSAVLFPAAIAATLFGVWLIRRVPSGRFYAFVYGVTFAIGLKLIYEGASAILAG